MDNYTTFIIVFLENAIKAQKNRIFWFFITFFLVFILFLSCFISKGYIYLLSSADFMHIRFVLIFILLCMIICTVNPKKFVSMGCAMGFVATAFGLKCSLALWTTYKFSQAKEFVLIEKPFLKFASCFFSVSKTNAECILGNNAPLNNEPFAYTNIISLGNLVDTLRVHVYIFIAVSLLFCILFFCRILKKQA